MPPYSEINNNHLNMNSWGGDSTSTSSPSRPRKPLNHHHHHHQRTHEDLVRMAAVELESMRKLHLQSLQTSPPSSPPCSPGSSSMQQPHHRQHQRQHRQQQHNDGSRSFPPACLSLLQSLPGNLSCMDCQSPDASWASVTYGAVLCLKCSGRHRGLGVQTSFVKSLSMDSWNHGQVLSMLEGGNAQLSQFFSRHKMSHSDPNYSGSEVINRYNTKAALFYKHHLVNHVKTVGEKGVYLGREASRNKSKGSTGKSSSRSSSSSSGKSSSSCCGGSPCKKSCGSSTHDVVKKGAPKIPTIEENSNDC